MTNVSAYAKSIFAAMPPGLSALAFLAGGCFRSLFDGKPVKDYDLFFASHDDWQLAIRFFRMAPQFTEVTKPGEEQYPSFHREGYPPFNVIGFRFHKDIKALAESFDFLCCQFAAEMVDSETVATHETPGARSDALTTTLRIVNHQHIDRVLRRARKYTEEYGYTTAPSWESDLAICRTLPRAADGTYTG